MPDRILVITVPLQGFGHLEGMSGAQKFQVTRDDRSTDRLPTAHTWCVLLRVNLLFLNKLLYKLKDLIA